MGTPNFDTMTDEELEAYIESQRKGGDAEGMTHTRSQPSGLGYVTEQAQKAAWEDTPAWKKPGVAYGMGANKVVTHGLNMIPGTSTFADALKRGTGMDITDEGLKRDRESRAFLESNPASMAGGMIGETATLTPLMMGGSGALSRIPALRGLVTAGEDALMSGPTRRMITEGAAQGATMAEPGDKGSGALFGGAAGAMWPASGATWNAAARGVNPGEEARTMLDKGVRLTVGQMNPRGWLNDLEQKWAHVIPVWGPKIKARRSRAFEDWQHMTIMDTAPPDPATFGQVVPSKAPLATVPRGKTVGETFANVDQAYTPAYDVVKGFEIRWPPKIMNTSGPDVPLFGALKRATKNPNVTANAEQRAAVEKSVMAEWSSLKPKKNAAGDDIIDSEDLLKLRSKVREKSRTERRSQDSDGRLKSELFDSAEDQITKVLESQLPGDAMAWVKQVDFQYAKNKIMEDALTRGKGKFGLSDVSNAVRDSALKFGSKRQYAKGQGLMRDYSDAGSDTFTTTAPATGAAYLAAAAPMAAVAANPLLGAAAVAPVVGALGSEAGRKLAGGMYPWQRGMRGIDERLAGMMDKAGPNAANLLATMGRTGGNSMMIPRAPAASQGAMNVLSNTTTPYLR